MRTLCNAKVEARNDSSRFNNMHVYCQLEEGHAGEHEHWTLTSSYMWSDKQKEARRVNRATG